MSNADLQTAETGLIPRRVVRELSRDRSRLLLMVVGLGLEHISSMCLEVSQVFSSWYHPLFAMPRLGACCRVGGRTASRDVAAFCHTQTTDRASLLPSCQSGICCMLP